MNRIKLITAALGLVIAGLVGLSVTGAGQANAAEAAECGDNSIIRCGAMSASDLKTKFQANDRDTQAIFAHYNVTAADVAGSDTAKAGTVNPDGTVVVDGVVVATNAYSVGRTNKLGSEAVSITNDTTVYQGQGRVKSPLTAFVFFNSDGTFRAAVIKVCGNPVIATPVKKPEPKPEPVYACDTLHAAKISRNEYRFTTKATAMNGATIKGYTYDFGDGTTATGGSVITHTYAAAGTFTASVTVQVAVDGTVNDAPGDCTVEIDIEAEQVKVKACKIKTGEIVTVNEEKIDDVTYTTDLTKCEDKPVVELPDTGLAHMLGGGFGAGTLSLAGYYYLNSRRML